MLFHVSSPPTVSGAFSLSLLLLLCQDFHCSCACRLLLSSPPPPFFFFNYMCVQHPPPSLSLCVRSCNAHSCTR
ncbi:hypothetical protein EON67_03935 [archaeon]|nr:MAG: hypothetical protein EON67_03935 [archaeon]